MPTFRYCTTAQFGPLLRERFRTSTHEVCIRIIQWLLQQSDADLRSWFGFTQTQLNQFRTRCNTKINAWNSLVGE